MLSKHMLLAPGFWKPVRFLLCLGLVGCHSGKEETLTPVSGTVTVEGKPLSLGWITFHPEEGRGNSTTHTPIGAIAKDGRYTLSTNGKPGAPLGFYKIIIAASEDPMAKPSRGPDGQLIQPKWLTNEKYTRHQTTDLHIEVIEKSPPGHYDLSLSK